MLESIILAAGSGNRMGTLTKDIPKAMIEINPGNSILKLNLAILNKLADNPRHIIIGGHGWNNLTKHIEDNQLAFTTPVANSQYNLRGPLYSLLLGLNKAQSERILILNGDTLFSPTILQHINEVLNKISNTPTFHLFVSKEENLDLDNIHVRKKILDGTTFYKASKNPTETKSRLISSGLLMVIGKPAINYLKDVIEDLITRENAETISLPWHSVIETVSSNPNSVFNISIIPKSCWMEFDTPEDFRLFREHSHSMSSVD
jgi:choline kinase